ncbi:MAG: S41 family peptidase, partial [Bacteroidota bacterium]
QALSEKIIGKMLAELDPYTTYISAKELATQNTELQSELEGIGVDFVMLQGTAYIVAPISGGPSEAAGIHAGDRIIKLDDEVVAGQGFKSIDLIKRLRGPKGTKVKLTIERRGQADLLNVVVKRDAVPFYSVNASYMLDEVTGYIKISRFTTNTFKEFKTAFSSLQKQGMSKLILDLRNNPGGHVEKATAVANRMLDKGQMIVQTKGQTSKHNVKEYAKGEDGFDNHPVIVLINEGSASGAEIIAGALQDNDRALVVGRRSFGKGLVQAPIQLQDGSQLRLTVARYYTPSGRLIQRSHRENASDYQADLIERYQQGEYFRSENIQFDDASKFQTSRGRIVYGGGGITPDYLVPPDDTTNTRYLKAIMPVLRQYASEYAEQHREKLTAMDYEDYRKHFKVTDVMLSQLYVHTEAAGIPSEEKVLRTAKPRLQLYLKAHIANHIWHESGFYSIYQQEDDIVQKALQLFDEAEALIKAPAIEAE